MGLYGGWLGSCRLGGAVMARGAAAGLKRTKEAVQGSVRSEFCAMRR